MMVDEWVVLANPPHKGIRLITVTSDEELAMSIAKAASVLLANTDGAVILAKVEARWTHSESTDNN